VGVIVLVSVADPLIVDVIEEVLESEARLEGLAPNDKDVVGVTVTEFESDKVELGVFDDVAVPEIVADDVGELEAVDELVILSEFELLAGVFEGLDPIERVADDENETDALREMVDEAVCEDVAVPEIVALDVGVTDGVFKALTVDDGVIDGETVALNEIEGEPFALPPMLSELVGVAVIVVDALAAIEPLSLPVLVPVGVELEVLEPVSEEELVGLLEGEFDEV
jgi:hypothetical protein